MKKRIFTGLMIGGLVFGAVFGMAASLGGIDSDNLGADDSVVASCDTDGIDAAYTTSYDATEKVYLVDEVNLTGIAAGCEDETLKVTLTEEGATPNTDSGTEIAEATVTPVGTDGSEDADFTADAVHAEEVGGIHVTISGTP